MKILITTDLYTQNVNGVVRSVMNLADELRQQGHRVKILTLGQRKRSYIDGDVTYLGSLDVSFIYPDARVRSARGRNVLKKLWEWRPDAIHSQCEFSTFLIANKLARELKVPLVHTYHTVYEDYTNYLGMRKGRFSKNVVRRLTRMVTDRCSAVIAPTEKVKKLLASYGVGCRLEVIPTGIDLSAFAEPLSGEQKAAMKSRLQIPRNDRILVFVGRLGKEKNIEEVIAYFDLLPQDGLTLLLVGDGPNRQTLEELAHSAKKRQKIVFTGMVAPEEVANYYKLGDVFVNASVSETQGLTYIEALAAGLPVVCRSDECLAGVVDHGENGFLFEDFAGFANGLRQVLESDEIYTAMASKAKETAFQKFSKEAFGRKAAELYAELQNER